MEGLAVHPDARAAWADMDLDAVEQAESIAVGGLPGLTREGNPGVAIKFTMPDGREVIGMTTLRLYLTSCDALVAAHGDPREPGEISATPMGGNGTPE